MDFFKACKEITEAEIALERAKRHKDERRINGYNSVLSRVNSNFDALLPSGITTEQRKMILGTLRTMNSVEALSEKFMNCAHALDKLLPGFSEPFKRQIESKKKSDQKRPARNTEIRSQEAENDRLESIVTPLQKPIRRARGSEISKSAQRVFVCWDKKDPFQLTSLIKDIHSRDIGVDCIVSYYDKPDNMPGDETITNELKSAKLVILLVTSSFLEQNKQKEFREFSIAKKLNQQGDLPILPIVVNEDLFSVLTISDNAIHGLAMDDREYRKKLGEQLSGFILDTEMIREISDKAFRGRLFLSYRKKDIDHARAFMKAFHDVPGFETVAVWYDNFLTAGRVFDQEIRDTIDNSHLFVVLVTPSLFEKNAEGKTNFVIAEEIPYAIKTGKRIVAVEAVPIDRAWFENICPGCKDFLTFDRLLNMAFLLYEHLPKDLSGDEETYLLGMAYSYEILVEYNHERAFNLFKSINESVSTWGIKASLELVRMWEEAQTDISYAREQDLLLQVINSQEILLGKNHPDIAESYNSLAMLHLNHDKFEDSLFYQKAALRIKQETFGSDHPSLAPNYNNIGQTYADVGNYDEALSSFQKALDIMLKESKDDILVSTVYNNMAMLYQSQCDYEKALDMCKKAYGIHKKNLGSEDSETLTIFSNMARIHFLNGNAALARNLYYQIRGIQKRTYGVDDPSVAKTCMFIANIHIFTNSPSRALAWLEEARQIQEKWLVGLNHAELAKTYSFIGVTHAMQGNHDDAAIWNERAIETYLAYLNGEETLDLALLYDNSAGISFYKGDKVEGLKRYEKKLEIQKKILGAEHPDTMETQRQADLMRNDISKLPAEREVKKFSPANIIRHILKPKESK